MRIKAKGGRERERRTLLPLINVFCAYGGRQDNLFVIAFSPGDKESFVGVLGDLTEAKGGALVDPA
jgi:hypothetical protein